VFEGDSMRLERLVAPAGRRKRRKRVGRGIGSGHGKTSGRGIKGQKARGHVRPGFEGGQTPLTRRMRKLRGVSKTAMPVGPFRKEYAIVNVGRLDMLEPEAMVTPQMLLENRVIRAMKDGLRVLGNGDITKPLDVHAHHFSASAAKKIEAAGGKVTVLPARGAMK